jgi:hypothetical protein
VVAAISTDWNVSWIFKGEALALNPYCPRDATDPDNLNLNVNGVKTAYGSDPNNGRQGFEKSRRQPDAALLFPLRAPILRPIIPSFTAQVPRVPR